MTGNPRFYVGGFSFCFWDKTSRGRLSKKYGMYRSIKIHSYKWNLAFIQNTEHEHSTQNIPDSDFAASEQGSHMKWEVFPNSQGLSFHRTQQCNHIAVLAVAPEQVFGALLLCWTTGTQLTGSPFSAASSHTVLSLQQELYLCNSSPI